MEDGLTPNVTELRHRYQTHKLQNQLTASARHNEELEVKIKTLQAANATLEANLKDSAATTSHAISSNLVSETTGQSDAMTQEVSNLSQLVISLDDKNTVLEEALSEYKSDPLEKRVQGLQGQLELYKQLLTKDRSGPRGILNLLSGTQMQKLVKSGLHRHNPTRQFVSETYYVYSQIVKERMEQKVGPDAKKAAIEFSFDRAADNGKPYTPATGEPFFAEESKMAWDSGCKDNWDLDSNAKNAD